MTVGVLMLWIAYKHLELIGAVQGDWQLAYLGFVHGQTNLKVPAPN